ncbi:MAG: F-type H+-transporting ATPase subunit gamma [Chloroflexota bacterium]|nr:F-type H+-transporting ATPase subunit gamma [Chloroflexota bacterium]
MATLRDLRRRIGSIQNTQKITKAMELVAAAKMRRAQQAMEASRPYAEGIADVLANLASAQLDVTHPLLEKRDQVKARLLVMVTADRGLAGGLNTNAIRAANRFIRQDSTPVRLVTIGRKGRDYFRRFNLELVADKSMLPDRPPMKDIRPPITVAIDEFLEGRVDEVWLEYTRYINAASQQPVVVRLIPPEIPERDETRGGPEAMYEFEPNAEAVLGELLPRYVEAQVYHAVLENQASEQAAKMAAMRSASDNAGELIQDLTLERNKLRQAQITRELMEIVGGAEALAQAS